MTALRTALARFITGGPGDFDELALALFRYQHRENSQYRAIFPSAQPTHWTEIPAVPVALWRDLALTCFPPDQTRLVFRTSGTTGRRGVVRRQDTELYDLGARRHAEDVVGPLPRVGVNLVPDAADSSLGHMVRTFAPELSVRFTAAGGVDAQGAWDDLHRFGTSTPVFIAGTALALAVVVEQARAPVPLAEGSIVMVTGGFKGRSVSLSADALRAELARLLPGARVVEEYGMTEMSSQLWAEGPSLPLRPPRWLRVYAVDPITGAQTDTGLLRFVDLANADTVLAFETRDVGTVLPDGRVVLHGRLPGAPARGCSLTVEEASQAPKPLPVPATIEDVPRGAHPHDRARAEAVHRALHALCRHPDPRFGQGLHPASVIDHLHGALAPLTPEALTAEAATVAPSHRPTHVALVEARGVFTAALEWVALVLTMGARLTWKPPSEHPHLARAAAEQLRQAGFDVTVALSHTLGDPDRVLAFGSDDTLNQLAQIHGAQRLAGFGHRFSAAVAGGSPDEATAIAHDHLHFDTRGCMAPAVVFVLDDPTALARALHAALGQAPHPRSPLPPGLGPEWRRRILLGRATGTCLEGPEHAVVSAPVDGWVPAALPRLITLVQVRDIGHLQAIVEPWKAQLSSLAVAPRLLETAPLLSSLTPRTCRLGQLQHPPFPRHHDGRPMARSLALASSTSG